ncbi:MAG: adenylate/guanylate cyclase domain-containing protein [Armatimonadetes bacterium]|nr:adenylate/guanylate cyclase domain-containing protein [Armatimonadota bacterium]
MKRANRNRLQKGALLFAVGILASLGFMRFFRGQPELEGGDFLTAALVGLLLACTQLAIEGMVLPRTRQMRLVPAVLIRATAYTVGAVGSVLFGISLANFLYGGVERVGSDVFFRSGWESVQQEWQENLPTGLFLNASVYALLIVLVLVFLGSVAQKLGPGVLWNWLIGRYHEPREERCVFLFLDLRGSTALAERLGDRRFSALIRDAFFDITPALLEHGARVSHFIGDEVVLYWTLRKGVQPGPEFARCFFAIQDLLAGLSPRYLQRYGVVPEFKAGAHWGTVIATDVGQIKSEIVFHGDVLNVASRLERLCGEEGAALLVSGELAPALAGEEGLVVDDLGERKLKGKEQAMKVASIRRAFEPVP